MENLTLGLYNTEVVLVNIVINIYITYIIHIVYIKELA